jgi:uric acid-xanthine permease
MNVEPKPTNPLPRRGVPSLSAVKAKITTKHGWVGDYDYSWLCLPTLPFGNNRRSRRPPPFYGLHDELPLVVAMATGLQHALAMLAGEYFRRFDSYAIFDLHS